jgi:hypothetical protein
LKLVADSHNTGNGVQLFSTPAYGSYQNCVGGHPGYITGIHQRYSDGFYYQQKQV